MKELEPKNKIAIVHTVEEQKQFGWTRSLIATPGHILWEFHIPTGTLLRVKAKKEVAIGMNGQKVQRQIVYEKADCLYFSALNEPNAWNWLRRALKKLQSKNPQTKK